MKRNFLILLCLFSLICPNLQAIHSPDDEAVERGAILRTLNYYFESENIGAPVELRKAYHPKATFMSVSNKTKQVEFEPVSSFFNKVDSDSYAHYRRTIKVKKLDIVGDAALVETVIDYIDSGKQLYDYLSLLKINGKWQIVNRISFKEYADFYNQPTWEVTDIDKERIDKSLRNYLKGGNKCDVEKMQKALHDDAVMAYVEEHSDQLKFQNKASHLREYAKKADNKLKRSHSIEFVHIRGNIAIAKVKVKFKDYKGKLTDYIALGKEGDNWKVISKVSNKEKMKYISSL